jgi:capsular polysaccharide transport system permease protein
MAASHQRHGVRVQMQVIWALLLREMLTRYGRHNIGFMWLFIEPMMFTLGVAALWSFSGMHRQLSTPVIAFAVTGYSSVLLWRNMPARCISAIEPNLALMYHRQVKLIDVFLSRLILEAAGATISFATLSILFVAIGWMKAPDDILKVTLAWLLLAWYGTAMALLLGALSGRSEIVEKLWHPVSYLLFPLSGAAFMVDWLPPAAQKVVLWLPMVHGVEYLRDGYFGSGVRTHYHLTYMASACLILTFLALAEERAIGRRIVPE